MVGEGCCVISVEVRDRYSPNEGGNCDMGIKGSILDERELDGDNVLRRRRVRRYGVEEEGIIDGDSLEGLSSIVLSRLGS